MKTPKRINRTHTFSLRMPERTRFGLDLLANREGVQVSSIALRAIDLLFEREGLTSREPGQLLSVLERVWDESDAQRLLKMQSICPELLSSSDRGALHAIQQVEEHNGRSLTPEEMDRVVADFRAGDFP
jgi:hypothetical protein